MSNGCSNACKLSPMNIISNVGAIGIHVMDSVGVRYVNACSNDLVSPGGHDGCSSHLCKRSFSSPLL